MEEIYIGQKYKWVVTRSVAAVLNKYRKYIDFLTHNRPTSSYQQYDITSHKELNTKIIIRKRVNVNPIQKLIFTIIQCVCVYGYVSPLIVFTTTKRMIWRANCVHVQNKTGARRYEPLGTNIHSIIQAKRTAKMERVVHSHAVIHTSLLFSYQNLLSQEQMHV